MNPKLREDLDKLRMYREKHRLVPREESIFIVKRIDEQSVADALQELPESVRKDLEKLAAEEPQTDEGWHKWPGPSVPFLGIITSGTKMPDAEWIEHRNGYRRGIEALRHYFSQKTK